MSVKTISLDGSGDADDSQVLTEMVDPSQSLPFDELFGSGLLEALLAELPSSQHRTVFSLKLAGHQWEDIARQVGISKRTAQERYRESREALQKVLLRKYGYRGNYS